MIIIVVKLTRPMTRIEMIIPFQFRGSGLDATSSWKEKNELYIIHMIDNLSLFPEIFCIQFVLHFSIYG